MPYFLLDFFLDFGREDLGTESTVPMAAFNRSNGVCVVGMGSIIPFLCKELRSDKLLLEPTTVPALVINAGEKQTNGLPRQSRG